jgi:hypothetical protein
MFGHVNPISRTGDRVAFSPLLTHQLVTVANANRVIIAIDAETGQVELAKVPAFSFDPESASRELQFPGGMLGSGEIVSVADCEPRPDHQPDWPWATLAAH